MAPQRTVRAGRYRPALSAVPGQIPMATNSRPLSRCRGVYIIDGSDGTHRDEEAAMPASIKIAVAGATGRVGRPVVELLEAGGPRGLPMFPAPRGGVGKGGGF